MCRSHGTQRNASLKVAGFDRSFNRSSLAGFHRSLTHSTIAQPISSISMALKTAKNPNFIYKRLITILTILDPGQRMSTIPRYRGAW
jgi:hypothetical protein